MPYPDGSKSATDELDEKIAELEERFQLSWRPAMFLECVCDGSLPKTIDFPNQDEDDFAIFDYLHELVGKGVVKVSGQITITWCKPDYQEYIASSEWRSKAEEAKERAGQRCQVCNTSRGKATLDTHHRTYERLGYELPEDLIVLCRGCHSLFHKNGKLAR